MGKIIDDITSSLKCGGKARQYPDGGKVKSDTTEYEYLKEASPASAAITEKGLARVKRLRGYQGTLTKDFQERHPDVPVDELLTEITGRVPYFSRPEVPKTGEGMIKKYGDLSIESEDISKILGPEAAAEYFEDTKTGRTAGKGDVGLERFGFRNMIYPQFRSKNTSLYQYLDKPKKGKGLQGGGPVGISMAMQSMMSSLTDEQREKLASGDSDWMGLEEKETGLLGQVISGGTEELLGITSAIEKRVTPEDDPRVDPAAAMKTEAGFETGKSILKGAGKGAAIGAFAGPGGAAIGAGIGVVTSGIKSLIGKKGREEEREEASNEWAGGWAKKYFKGREGYEEGGPIKGPGGPKTDSINMKAKSGSFIVPAENYEAGMQLGRDYLGWTDESIAGRKQGGTAIKVSDGEVLYTPEEVEKLDLLGVDLNKLAPNAKPGNKMANGTFLEKKAPMMADTGFSSPMLDELKTQLTPEQFEQAFFQTISSGATKPEVLKGKNLNVSGVKVPGAEISSKKAETEAEEDKFKLESILPEMAATAQVLGAIKGLGESGKRPDLAISSRLKKLATDTQEAATFGLEPDVRNAYMREIERTRRDVMNKIIGRGGSAGEIREALGKITSTTLAAKAKIPIMETEMKLRKTAINVGVEQNLAKMQFDKSKVEREDWFHYQEAWGTMLSEGLKNFIGARQYKENLDYMKSVGSTTPSFTEIKTK